MKYIPILFSGQEVRAILDGTKTKTRIVMQSRWFSLEMCNTSKPPHLRYNEFQYDKDQGLYECGSGPFDPRKQSDQDYAARFCPYGQPGDRLWVRETFIPKRSGALYRANFDSMDAAGISGLYGGWKPSIHMPRQLSRITLENTGVRVERLQDISVADVISEGVRTETGAGMIEGETTFQFTTSSLYGRGKIGAIAAFQDLWESIHGGHVRKVLRNGTAQTHSPRHPKYNRDLSWAANPWVWVVKFRRVKP